MIRPHLNVIRPLLAAAVLLVLWPQRADAQAPPTAPLVLTLPTSARVAALGGAWVAGRDQDVIFTNPAQLIGTRADLAVSFLRAGPAASGLSIASTYAAGKMSLTLGFGFQLVNFTAGPGQPPPYSPDLLLTRGEADAQTSLAVVGGAIVYKGFRIGAAGKYAADRTDINRHALLLDLGLSRTLFGGVAAVAGQNLGHHDVAGALPATIPRQIVAGWSRTKTAGPLDLALFTQVTKRHGWTSPAAGLEAGYSWIEGYGVTLRAGVRRPESAHEHPVALGAAFTADRVTVEYAVRFFDTGNRAHMVTLRWR